MRIPLFTNLLAVAHEAPAAARAHFASRPLPIPPQRPALPAVPVRRSAMEASIRQQFANRMPTGGSGFLQQAAATASVLRNPSRPLMHYRPAMNMPAGRGILGNLAGNPFMRNMTAQRIGLSIANFERNRRLKEQEESQMQQAIKASLQDLRATGRGWGSAPVTMNTGAAARVPQAPVFHQQFKSAEAALQSGHPTGNMCGALALAHMTGTAPQWPQLHQVAMDDLLKHVPPGRATPEQLKAAHNTVYDGVYIEHLQAMLKKNKVPFETLSAVDPNDIDQVFNGGKCNGVTFGYVRPSSSSNPGGGTAHFAALRKDASGQWWDMDSYHDKPQKISSPSAFLKDKCQGELRAGRGFDMIYTNA
ncbi:hypothetical protein PMI16_04418 [Herbaspirillum sp. CF444]|uniref:hypothetical protein n=1 Tax=Herbaspirillum sp. CF444 TaxID=1144319 RepID=UPI00027263AC|nr:hypothetical protein [Herbaspirillum sp. CF444]EJL82625.1 hypothetical protein PMI16_04418 [Herbaspirillum sp. CF444]